MLLSIPGWPRGCRLISLSLSFPICKMALMRVGVRIVFSAAFCSVGAWHEGSPPREQTPRRKTHPFTYLPVFTEHQPNAFPTSTVSICGFPLLGLRGEFVSLQWSPWLGGPGPEVSTRSVQGSGCFASRQLQSLRTRRSWQMPPPGHSSFPQASKLPYTSPAPSVTPRQHQNAIKYFLTSSVQR